MIYLKISGLCLPQTGYNDMIYEWHKILLPNETRWEQPGHNNNDLLFLADEPTNKKNDDRNTFVLYGI